MEVRDEMKKKGAGGSFYALFKIQILQKGFLLLRY